MNAVYAIIPILLIRYGLTALVNRQALPRAAHYAPLVGNERAAYWVYQVTTLLIFIEMFFIQIDFYSRWFIVGIFVYSLGIILYAISVVNFAKPAGNGMNLNGLYKISRNPMYIAYFIVFLGCAVLTGSWTLLALLVIFQISAHWIILSEERWCLQQFGGEYLKYKSRVRRYL